MNIIDLSGKRFNSLLVIERAKNTSKWGVLWLCRCDCGSIVELRGDHLKQGQKTCQGCAKKARITHGLTRTSEYVSWNAMIDRCENPNNPKYKDYGGRGIKICKRWRGSFVLFLKDMGHKPSAKHSIDRFPNNDGNYTPSNCRWATKKQQVENRRNSINIEFNGETKSLKNWAIYFGVDYDFLRFRYYKQGNDVLATVHLPPKLGKRLKYNGKEMNISDWSKETGLSISQIHIRLWHGWDVAKTLSTPIGFYFNKKSSKNNINDTGTH